MVLDNEVVEEKSKEKEVDILDVFNVTGYDKKKYVNNSIYNDTQENTKKLIVEAQNGSNEAIDLLVEQNIGLIWSSVRRFTNRGVDNQDLFQIGAMGLIKCIKKFDVNYDVKFSTYAVPMIIGEIKRFLRDDGIVKVSRHLKELSIKGRLVHDILSKELGRTPTVNEVAKRLECDVDDLVLAFEANSEVESLYATTNQQSGQTMFLIDKIANNKNGLNEDKIIDNLSLRQVIGSLEGKERQIIILRYFQDKTQSETAKIIGVSQVQVSRLEKKILEKMGENLKR